MNAAPEESLYVGDVYSVDYLGATGAGMQALLMDVPGAYRDKGVPRVDSLEDLQDRAARKLILPVETRLAASLRGRETGQAPSTASIT